MTQLNDKFALLGKNELLSCVPIIGSSAPQWSSSRGARIIVDKLGQEIRSHFSAGQ